MFWALISIFEVELFDLGGANTTDQRVVKTGAWRDTVAWDDTVAGDETVAPRDTVS